MKNSSMKIRPVLPALLTSCALLAVLHLRQAIAANAVHHFSGMCDASAVVALDSEYFVVADDEDNLLRVYSRNRDGPAIYCTNLSAFLRVRGKVGESDLEGAARVGNRIYWISSHGANAAGKFDPNRHRLFATTGSVANGVVDVRPIGKPYLNLLKDLVNDPKLAPFGLAAAARRAPKSPGALNIEGLGATPEGHLLIGFRNPVPNGLALLVPLLNPDELIQGARARFGDPILLDLGGLSVRSLERSRSTYLIIAGAWYRDGVSRLFAWNGGADIPRPIDRAQFTSLNPEALTFFQAGSMQQMWIVSDDGTVKIAGVDCKRLKIPRHKNYRAVGIDPSPIN